MSKKRGVRTGLLCAGASVAIGLAGIAAQRLSPSVVNLLVLWIMLSVPLGIAVGHCALDER
jgi:hypothetical protein